MCTSFTYQNNDFYLGRNLDLECGFGQKVVIVARNKELKFRHEPSVSKHYAILGMASVIQEDALFAEAINEKGLGMCGLQFSGNAHYFNVEKGKINLAPFELITYILATCSNTKEAKEVLDSLNIINEPYAENVPNSDLHFILADKENCFVIESCKDGLHVYENQYGALTNNPPFPFHDWNMQQYLNLTDEYPINRTPMQLEPYAVGMGSVHLPGDPSSVSRFVKTAYLKSVLYSDGSETDNVQQFFRVLDQVAMIKGSVKTKEGKLDHTIYSSCMNATKGIYYYTTYQDRNVRSVCMHDSDLNQDQNIIF